MISPRVRRLRLAAELVRLREEAGLTHEQLAHRIGESRAKISRLENSHIAPDQGDIIKILEALNVDGQSWNQILTIAREAAEKGWWESNSKQMSERQALFANLEAGAVSIREYQQALIPGLLQTPDYTRTRTKTGMELRPLTSGATLEGILVGRAGRQRMLNRPGGPSYEVILDELAVRRLAAPPQTHADQLRYMASRGKDERITVRLLPVDALIADYFLPVSGFSMYTYPDPGDPVVVGIESITTDFVLTDQQEVAGYTALYESLREAALTPDDTREYLIKAAETLPER